MKKLGMIDLTRKPEKDALNLPMPSGGYAPMIYLEDVPGIEDFPEQGTMVVKFKRTSLSVRTDDRGTRVSMTLEIPYISEVMPEKGPKESEDKAEDVLDQLLAEATKENTSKENESDENDED